MVAEIYKPQITELKKLFIQEAFLRDPEKGYVVVEKFNLAIDPSILYLASQAWATYFEDKKPIDAVVGLADAGSRLAPFLAHMLEAKAILPAKRTPKVPKSWRDVVSYTNYSFTLETEITSHIGFVKKGMRILLVDDVIAHGPTAIAAIKALQAAGVEIVGLAVMFDKVTQGGVAKIVEETRIDVCSLLTILGFTNDHKVILK